jgi:hypothetical protein
MRYLILILGLILIGVSEVGAGCIGPVINGECKGREVPWDTHPPGYQEERPAPPGFYWDHRGTKRQQKHPEWINPFSGRDQHDSDWFKRRER